ncbi:MAG: hypothetical protein ACR2PL_14245 [Dehalococcoidia bacterium]
MKRWPITATLTGKGQLTVLAAIRNACGIKRGAKIDIVPLTKREGFSALVRRPSHILDFLGFLKRWRSLGGTDLPADVQSQERR